MPMPTLSHKLFVSFAALMLLFSPSVLVANAASDGDIDERHEGAMPTTSSIVLGSTLRGRTEVPGPGDPDGHGWGSFDINRKNGMFCYNVHAHQIGNPTAAHIHHGKKGEAGPVVIPLQYAGDGIFGGCMTVDSHLLEKISKHPRHYYVNVHTAEYPAGAIRGQLRR